VTVFFDRDRAPPHHVEMIHFLPEDFEHFYWLLELGLDETIHMLYNDGSTLRRNYFRHYKVNDCEWE